MTDGLIKAINEALGKEGKTIKLAGNKLSDIMVDDKVFRIFSKNKDTNDIGEKINIPKYKVSSIDERTVDGITFDSKGEMQRYLDLCMQEKQGIISDLVLQPEFTLQEGYRGRDGKYIKPVKIVLDFSYWEDEKFVVEDFKGHRTAMYLVKKKLFRKKYPSFEYKETGKGDI